MALPKINSAPSYSVTVPSTGQEVTFRPFLVREQKTLLIALETQGREDMVRAIVRTIEACVEQDIKGELTTFDVDYLFTKIRSKSVGETSDLLVECTNCGHQNEVTVELDDIEIKEVPSDTQIKLTDDITIQMRYPTYGDFLKNPALINGSTVTESMLELIMTCIDSVMTEEEKFTLRDESKEDIIAFVESMTTEQFNRIGEFVENIPSITSTANFTCVKCQTENERTFAGIDDFF